MIRKGCVSGICKGATLDVIKHVDNTCFVDVTVSNISIRAAKPEDQYQNKGSSLMPLDEYLPERLTKSI